MCKVSKKVAGENPEKWRITDNGTRDTPERFSHGEARVISAPKPVASPTATNRSYRNLHGSGHTENNEKMNKSKNKEQREGARYRERQRDRETQHGISSRPFKCSGRVRASWRVSGRHRGFWSIASVPLPLEKVVD